ncbi:hypothetical protein PIB30_078983 [Stylosanthes scabra]|uniref:Uncharacterized protein n=1 Tax=Stylosanthes scabra TaxID=79078 RepID=A0ABU6YNM4_9FABA|nr:hypothetical protein [Stylosanthes scabra]
MEETSGKKVIDLTEGRCCRKDVSLEEVAKFTYSQMGLHGFEGRFGPFGESWEGGCCEIYAGSSCSVLCISRGLEVQALEEEVSQKSKKSDSLHKSLELERKLQFATEQIALKEKEIGLLKDESEELKSKVAKLSKDKKDSESRVVDLCGDKKEVEDKAKAHAKLFAPGVKFDKMDPVKVLYKGELIDDDQVIVEGSDDHNPAE